MPGVRRPHRVTDIAEQSGLSAATVDRVLHGRPGVSARAVRAVEQAMLDLDRQQSQLKLGARALMLDLVMQAPRRFSGAVRQALEAELPSLRPATVRVRFQLRESGTVQDLVSDLDAIGRSGRSSQGVLLKAPDHPEVVAVIARLWERGIPVVTLVTDVRASARVAYVGLDNTSAGNTAAYLMQQWLGRRRGAVLVTLSRATFFGERERLAAFETAMANSTAKRALVVFSDADGLDEAMGAMVGAALDRREDVIAAYSIGGGNRAILAEFARRSQTPRVFLAHDLDADNVALLRQGSLSAVLHHDLGADLRHAVVQLCRHHKLLPGAPTSVSAGVQVVTPFNVPTRLPARLSSAGLLA